MKARLLGVSLAVALASGMALAQDHAAHGHGEAAPAAGGQFEVPSSIRTEHQHIHGMLEAAINAGGKTGAAAKEVERLLADHFGKEERFAMKPLGLLVPLAKGEKIDHATAQKAIEATGELRKDYDTMLQEHKAILAALGKLESAAKEEQNKQALQFVETLKLHAQNEEQILYPAALLVGKTLQGEHGERH